MPVDLTCWGCAGTADAVVNIAAMKVAIEAAERPWVTMIAICYLRENSKVECCELAPKGWRPKGREELYYKHIGDAHNTCMPVVCYVTMAKMPSEVQRMLTQLPVSA
jgi:hypothetical protein